MLLGLMLPSLILPDLVLLDLVLPVQRRGLATHFDHCREEVLATLCVVCCMPVNCAYENLVEGLLFLGLLIYNVLGILSRCLYMGMGHPVLGSLRYDSVLGLVSCLEDLILGLVSRLEGLILGLVSHLEGLPLSLVSCLEGRTLYTLLGLVFLSTDVLGLVSQGGLMVGREDYYCHPDQVQIPLVQETVLSSVHLLDYLYT